MIDLKPLIKSIQTNGLQNAIDINWHGQIIHGWCRYLALITLRHYFVLVRFDNHHAHAIKLSDLMKKNYIYTGNKEGMPLVNSGLCWVTIPEELE